MGAAGALLMAFAKRRLDMKTLRSALDATTKLSAFVMMILIGSRVFGLTFYGINGAVWVEDLMLALPGGEYGFLIVVTIIIFILGCFLDFFEIAFIMVPLLAPVADALGIDLVWFGVILGINLQTSFLTPPFGFSLFYLRSVAPSGKWKDKVTGRTMEGMKTADIYRGVFPYIVIQFVMIMVVIAFPQLVMRYKGDAPTVDPNTINIQIPGFGGQGGGMSLPPLGQGTGGNQAPNLGLPPLGAPGQAPAFGLPPITTEGGLPGAAPAAPAAPAPAPAIDLSQPPVIR